MLERNQAFCIRLFDSLSLEYKLQHLDCHQAKVAWPPSRPLFCIRRVYLGILYMVLSMDYPLCIYHLVVYQL